MGVSVVARRKIRATRLGTGEKETRNDAPDVAGASGVTRNEGSQGPGGQGRQGMNGAQKEPGEARGERAPSRPARSEQQCVPQVAERPDERTNCGSGRSMAALAHTMRPPQERRGR